jgi:hypothetical protein
MRRVLTLVLLSVLVSCTTQPVLPPTCEDHLVPINPTSITGDINEARPSR